MKTLNTIEAIGAELDKLSIERVDTGAYEAEDWRELNMKLRILQQRADLIKNHALEAKLDALEELVKAKMASVTPLRRAG